MPLFPGKYSFNANCSSSLDETDGFGGDLTAFEMVIGDVGGVLTCFILIPKAGLLILMGGILGLFAALTDTSDAPSSEPESESVELFLEAVPKSK